MTEIGVSVVRAAWLSVIGFDKIGTALFNKYFRPRFVNSLYNALAVKPVAEKIKG